MLQGGPNSRLRARTEYAYRLFDAYRDLNAGETAEAAARSLDHETQRLDVELLEFEHELHELFGPRPSREDRAVIRSRSETRRPADEDLL